MTIREPKKKVVKNGKEVFRFERGDGMKIVIYENMQAIFLCDEEGGHCFQASPESVLRKFLAHPPNPLLI